MNISLSSLLGQALSEVSGLAHVHLPEGIRRHVAIEIVTEANAQKPSKPPFAFILSSDSAFRANTQCPVVTAKESIRYRQGNHMAVVVGQQPDLSSFNQVFRPIFGQSYPDAAAGFVGLDKLAGIAVRRLYTLAGLTPSENDLDTGSGIIGDCFNHLRKLHISQTDNIRTWNATWFDHTNLGLENLKVTLVRMINIGADLTLSNLIRKYAYACFGLPRPNSAKGGFDSKASAGSALNSSLSDYWSDSEKFEITSRRLPATANSPADSKHPLAALSPVALDKSMDEENDSWLGLTSFMGKNPDFLDAFSTVTENDFCDPGGLLTTDQRLSLFDSEGLCMNADSTESESPFLIPINREGTDQRRTVSSDVIEIRIPIAPVEDNLLSSPTGVEDFQVTFSPENTFSWTPINTSYNHGYVSLSGKLIKKLGAGTNKIPFKNGSLTVTVSPTSPYAPLVSPKLFSLFYSFEDASSYLVLATRGINGKLSTPQYLGPLENYDPDSDFAEELKSVSRGYTAILWNPDSDSPSILDGTRLQAVDFSSNLFVTPFSPSGENEFIAGGSIFRIRPYSAGEGQHSALLAAALKQQVQSSRPGIATEQSIRGKVEEFYSSMLVDNPESIYSALGHIMMPTDMQVDINDICPQDGGIILMDKDARSSLSKQDFFDFDHEEFINGPEVSRMRDALRALNLNEVLARSDSGSGPQCEWPSRTSFRSLWQSHQLEEYLSAYVGLIAAAHKTEIEELIFWASYPMSVSIWDVTRPGGCQGVLLSPLHPIRLAWLAGVESTLFGASNASNFMGSIEGWNLPLSGPGESPSRQMIAVPSDSGEGQIFLGWSMLVPAGTAEAKPVSAPRQIGSMTAPGSAISGLNSTAVNSAMRSFRKMHPHVTTLTVDLQSSERQGRIHEIDSAILKIAEDWGNSSSSGLVGGLRVYDSAYREGPTPRDEVTRIVRNNKDLLLTWSRYFPSVQHGQTCNIRFLQSTGTAIRVSEGTNKHGVVGHVPLRRFTTSASKLSRKRLSSSEPGVPTEIGWLPFTSALAAMEGQNGLLIEAGMQRRDIDDVTSDWTVLGESFLSPAVMASLMDNEASGSRMLWEWRPPVLDKQIGTGVALMEKRPFISVARVPVSFGDQLSELLAKATGLPPSAELKKKVMATLGSRGVGLSSLISMGGTHVAGALGFYLTLSLLDQVSDSNTNRLVMPIDAADYFLRILAGGAEHGRERQRADLLYIEITDNEMKLSPVEIKCYGLQSDSDQSTGLPGPNSSALDKSLVQLKASHQLFSEIQEQANNLKGEEAVLWRNSLATLVETAARLSPKTMGPENLLSHRLSRIVEGKIKVTTGRPLLNFFQHGASEPMDTPYFVGDVGSQDFPAQGLIARTDSVFASLANEKSELVRDWSRLLLDAAPSEKPQLDDQAQSSQAAGGYTSVANPADVVPDVQLGHEQPPARPQMETLNAPVGAEESVVSIPSKRDTAEPSPADLTISGEGIRLNVGHVIDSVGHATVDFWPSNTQLNQLNVGIVGDLGTGKTELIKSLITGIRAQSAMNQPSVPTSMLILDYKGDFQTPEFLKRVGGVVLEPHRIPINIFLPETGDYSRKPYQQAAAFVDTLGRIYSGVGPVQARNLNASIRELYEENNGEPPTLAEVHARYDSKVGSPDSVLSILDGFVYGEIFSSDRTALVPFSHLLEGKVVVVALDKLGQDQRAKNALVALFLNIYYDHMLRSGKLDFCGTDPQLRFIRSYLLVDEAVNIMRHDFEVLMNLMLQGRQFGVGTILASQYLSHFREGKVNHGQPLRTWFIHKVPTVSVRELEALGMPGLRTDVVQRIPELGLHEVLYKSYGWDDGRFVRVTPYYEL